MATEDAVPTWAIALALAVTTALTGCAVQDAASPGRQEPTVVRATPSWQRGEDPPLDASTEEFCAVVARAPDRPTAETAEAWAAVGTPGDIPAEARAGFKEFVVARGVPGDAEERTRLVALARYVADTCGAFPAGPG